jgi:hypothetical protein
MEANRDLYLQQLEKNLRMFVDEKYSFFSLSEKSGISEFIEAGEYGLAFETICFLLKRNSADIPVEFKERIRELANSMKTEIGIWRDLV